MAEWELHALRRLVSVINTEAVLHARVHAREIDRNVPAEECDQFAFVCEQAWRHFRQNRARAMRNPQFRRGVDRASPNTTAPDVPTDVS